MPQIKGTNVVAPVVPLDTADVHPSHEARYGKGGYRTVATVAERDAIPAPRREAGMLVYVEADGKAYQLAGDLATWNQFNSGASSWADLSGKPSTFPPDAHGHTIAEVSGLSAALDGKQAVGSYVLTTDPRLTDARQPLSHNHTASQISDFTTAVVAAAPPTTDASLLTSGTLDASRLPGSVVLTTDPRLTDARQPLSHTHDDRYYTEAEVDTLLAGKQATGSYVLTTDARLSDARQPLTHQHVAADITDFTSAVIAAAPPTTNASLLTSGTLPDARLSANIARTSDVTAAVAAVIDAAPASLDTLNELAAALGDDANFATTVTNALAAKAPLASPTFTGTVSGITAAMVGLGNVPNVDATSRANHTGTQAASTISNFSNAAAAAAPVQSVAGRFGAVTLAKGDVGLGNVDNTSDASKPISTATQTALDGKAAVSHTHSAAQISDFSSAVAAASPEEVVEYTTPADFPATGNSSLLYVATDNARAYRWVGSQYAEVGPTSLFMQGHTHAASEIVSGTIDAARLPSSGVSASSLTVGTVDAARLPFATTAQAQDLTSSTVAMSPLRGRDQTLSWIRAIPRGVTTASGGSAQVFTTTETASITCGSTANGVAKLWNAGPGAAYQLFHGGTHPVASDWTKPRSLWVRGFLAFSTTNGIARVIYGLTPFNSLGITGRAIGFEIRNLRLWMLAHNGSALTATDTGQNVPNGTVSFDVLVRSDGAGGMSLLYNGTQISTSSGGPSTTDASNAAMLAYECTNGTDAAGVNFNFSAAWISVA